MSELKPELASLVRAGRTAFRPDAADRERVLQSLAVALGEGAPSDAASHAGTAKGVALRGAMRGWALGGLGALAVVSGALVVTHPWRTAPASAPVVAAPLVRVDAPAAPAANQQAPVAVESLPSAPQTGAHSQSVTVSADTLAQEVRLLSRAEQQLNAGHADEALKTLGEHERRFPEGALAEERMAARVQSLCAVGRIEEAKADLRRLARAYPQSPHLDRARKFCRLDAR